MKRYPKTILCASCGKTAKLLYRSSRSDPGIYRCGACGDDTDAETGKVCGGGLTDGQCKELGLDVTW